MTKNLLTLTILMCLWLAGFAQPINIYQPNGNTTNFGKATSDSLNYYVVNYPALTLVKIDGNNTKTTLCTLTVDPFQTMVWNNGKGIYPVSNGSPFKLFDGSSQIDINGGQMPMAGYTVDKVIAGDYFHRGNYSYFRTSKNIYKTDFSSIANIQSIASADSMSLSSPGIFEMYHTTNSIIFQDVVAYFSQYVYLKRIDLNTGIITKIDSTINTSFDEGLVYNNEYYYCTPYPFANAGKINKVSDNGVITTLYTENGSNLDINRIVGVTPNGVICLSGGLYGNYVSVSGGIATPLNFNTPTDPLPSGVTGVGTSRSTSTLVYFETLDTTYTASSTKKALWVTDGTLLGTRKVMGGSTTFSAANLSTQYAKSAENCGNDLYFDGTDGVINGNRLIYVNGGTFTHQTYATAGNPYAIRKTANGITFVANPFPTTSSEKAVFKVNCSSSTGLEENLAGKFEVFPNPSNGNITISLLSVFNGCMVNICNLLGEIVYSEKLKAESTNISLDLKSGLYFVTLENEGQKMTKKLIIE